MKQASGEPLSLLYLSMTTHFQICPLGVSLAHQFCSKSIQRSKAPSIVQKRKRKNPSGQERKPGAKSARYTDGNGGNNAPIKKCHDHDTYGVKI